MPVPRDPLEGIAPRAAASHAEQPSGVPSGVGLLKSFPGKGLAVSSEQRIGGSARVAFYLRPAQRALRPLIIEESS